MAEAIFNDLTKNNNDYEAISAGIMAHNGMDATEDAIDVMNELNIDLRNHKSQIVNEQLLDESEYVICMTDYHLKYLLENFPQYSKKYSTLTDKNIDDPYYGDYQAYKTASEEIKKGIKNFIDNILKI